MLALLSARDTHTWKERDVEHADTNIAGTPLHNVCLDICGKPNKAPCPVVSVPAVVAAVCQRPSLPWPAALTSAAVPTVSRHKPTQQQEVQDIFYKYGDIRRISIKPGEAGGLPAFCFVEFDSADDAYDAVKGLDGREKLGKRLRVSVCRGLGCGAFAFGRGFREVRFRRQGSGNLCSLKHSRGDRVFAVV